MILASAIIVTRALVSCHVVDASLLNRNLQFPTEVRGVVNSGFGVLHFSPPRWLSVSPKIGGSVNVQQFSSPSHTRQRLALCAVLFKLFRSDVTGWQSLTKRCS